VTEPSEPGLCSARIRPLTGDVEIACEETGPHDRHQGVLRDYAWPGSATTVEWDEQDRRNFHGSWPGRCPSPCVLLAGHHGNHAP